jgi:radical SAM protein with 4Fe4S-binding SPASM domain
MHQLFQVLAVETTNTCTRKCWFCKFGQKRQDEVREVMPWELIEKIVFNLRDLEYEGRLSWYWINEPLLDKRMRDIIAFSREQLPGAFLNMTTNGDLLSDELYQQFRSAGLDAMAVSVYDDRTMDRLIGMQGDRVLVPLDMRNADEKVDNRAGNIVTDDHRFDERVNVYRHTNCAHPSKSMHINARGQVALCCSDMYVDVPMGDVREERLEEIWNNEKFNHYRRTLATKGRESLPLCQNCTDSGAGCHRNHPLHTLPPGEADALEQGDDKPWVRILLDRQAKRIQLQEQQLLEKEIVIQQQHAALQRRSA